MIKINNPRQFLKTPATQYIPSVIVENGEYLLVEGGTYEVFTDHKTQVKALKQRVRAVFVNLKEHHVGEVIKTFPEHRLAEMVWLSEVNPESPTALKEQHEEAIELLKTVFPDMEYEFIKVDF